MLYKELKVLTTNTKMLNDTMDFVARSSAYPVNAWQWSPMAARDALCHIVWRSRSPPFTCRRTILVSRIVENWSKRQIDHMCGHNQAAIN